MEDPKRMRTKLRLDLKDVRRQIEELEDEMKKDKSSENVEAHRKLVEYEKKLKDQYEKLSGLSIDQASNLDTKGGSTSKAKGKKSPFSGLLALLGGALVSWGYYNTVLHSIEGFAPQDVINYFTGTGASVSDLNFFMLSILYGISMLMVVLPIGVGSLMIFLSGMFDQSRGKLFSFLEGLGFLGTAGLFSYILYTTSPDAQAGTDLFLSMLFIFSLLVIGAGFFLLLGGLSQPSWFRKLLGFIVAGLFLFSGAQYFILNNSNDIQNEFVNRWPWITLPIVIASGLYAFLGLLRFKSA